jgi:AraC family L-rhamnose operon regulatory protein RhaS
MDKDAWTTTGKVHLPGRTIPLGVSRGDAFDPEAGFGERLRFVSVAQGAGVFTRGGRSIPFRAPVYFCLDERERVRIDGAEGRSTTLVYFHPSILRSDLDFGNVRPPLRDALPADALREAYWLTPFVDRADPSDGIVIPGLALARRVAELADRMLAEARDQPSGWWPCRTRSFLIEMLFSIVTEYESPPELASIPEDLADDLVRRFFIQVGSRYAEKLTVEDLARELGTNRTTLQDRVSSATGKSVAECVSGIRLDAARMLLTDTLLPIAEVAERSGYADTSSFTRAFRQRFGMPPKEFRDAHGSALLAR